MLYDPHPVGGYLSKLVIHELVIQLGWWEGELIKKAVRGEAKRMRNARLGERWTYSLSLNHTPAIELGHVRAGSLNVEKLRLIISVVVFAFLGLAPLWSGKVAWHGPIAAWEFYEDRPPRCLTISFLHSFPNTTFRTHLLGRSHGVRRELPPPTLETLPSASPHLKAHRMLGRPPKPRNPWSFATPILRLADSVLADIGAWEWAWAEHARNSTHDHVLLMPCPALRIGNSGNSFLPLNTPNTLEEAAGIADCSMIPESTWHNEK
jgi:hypothetical protein